MLEELHAAAADIDALNPAFRQGGMLVQLTLGRPVPILIDGHVPNGNATDCADALEPVGVVTVDAMRHDFGEKVGIVHFGHVHHFAHANSRRHVFQVEGGRYASVPLVEHVL